MARGRMVIKEIASDARLWEQLSEQARDAFLWLIPHSESDGTLPRNPRDLRVMVYPCNRKLRDSDVESFIQEWLRTSPPIASEVETKGGRKRLKLNDFSWANENLSSRDRVRRYRGRNASNASNACNSMKGSEVKGSEVKVKKQITDIAPPASAKAEREPTPIQRVVNAYKEAKGVGMEDKGWDKSNFGRYSKAAKSLLDCLGGWEQAVVYVLGKGQEFDEKSIPWTLETIQRHAWDDRGKLNGA